MDPAHRPDALVRSMTLLAIVVFPLAVGLGTVAPTLVATIFDARWRPVAPMLVLLSALSVARPVGWMVESYLQARQKPRLIFWLEGFKVIALVLFIVTFGRVGPLWTCVAVGVAFAAHALACLWVVREIDGVPLRRSLGGLLPALVACAPMVVAVLAARHLLARYGGSTTGVALGVEVFAGASSYVVAALIVAHDATLDLWARVVDAMKSHA
jgi:PST family polysaccharide transporter